MIWSIVQAFFSLVFASQPRFSMQGIIRGTGEGGWDEEDADHLRKKIPRK